MNIDNCDNIYDFYEYFVRIIFEKYNINYSFFFDDTEEESFVTENDFGEFANCRLSSDPHYISKAAEILGTTYEAIIELDTDQIYKYYDKYPYFKLLPLAMEAYNREWKLQHDNDIDMSEITSRLIDTAKRFDDFIPGTFHPNAKIERLSITTHVIADFDQAKELWTSYLEMVDNAQKLFFKILHDEPISKDEIMEYNFLVSVLNIHDAVLPNCFLHYSSLVKLRPVYLEYGYTEFYSFAKIKMGPFSNFAIRPWDFTATASDKDIIQRYINIHPVCNGDLTKEYIRKKVMEVKNYHCCFQWSDAMPLDPYDKDMKEIKETTELYLPKEPNVTTRYAKSCEKLSALISPSNQGGISMPKRELPYQHYYPRMHQMPTWIKQCDKHRMALRGEL